MTIGLLVIWLLVGIDLAVDGTWTPTDPTVAGEVVDGGLVEALDGPVLPPPPPNP